VTGTLRVINKKMCFVTSALFVQMRCAHICEAKAQKASSAQLQK
jgi:hypothetical protein